MVAGLLVIALGQSSIQSELNGALTGVKRFDHSFHASIGPVLAKHNLDLIGIKKSFGPMDARVIAANDLSNPAFGMQKTFIVWRSNGRLHIQGLYGNYENRKEHAIGDAEVYVSEDAMTMCDGLQDDSNAPSPAIRTYAKMEESWIPVMTAIGTYERSGLTHFRRRYGRIDQTTVIANMRMYPPHLSQPHAGPLQSLQAVYKVDQHLRIRVESLHHRDTPLAALDDIVAAFRSGNHRQFARLVPKPYQKRLRSLIEANGGFGVEGDDDDGSEFKVGASGSESASIRFRRSHGHWRVSTFSPSGQAVINNW